jgi:hypothetical protein
MNLFTGEASRELFGQTRIPEAVRAMLEEAQTAQQAERREQLLWTARAAAPDCLAVYYLLYKFYATRRELEAAERAARGGLEGAARQAGLAEDWRAVVPGAADFTQPGPARFWLFTLKALAFIRLRAGASTEARSLLDKLRQLDPADHLGAGVVGALAEAAAPSPSSQTRA